MKFLIWALLAALIIAWLMRGKKAPGAAAPTRKQGVGIDGEAMIRCAQCGTHIPASESVVAPSGLAYCSEEHRRLHAE